MSSPEDIPGISLYQRILDRSDATGRAQFHRVLGELMMNTHIGGASRPRMYWGPIKRYRNREVWQLRMRNWAGTLFMDGWQAAERFHGVEGMRLR